MSSSTSPTFGSLKQRPARALDTCAAFLRGMPSYTLYYWEVAESQQLLSSCLQRLSNHANANDALSAALMSRKGGTASVGSNITSRRVGGSNRSGSCGTRRQNSDEEINDDDEMTNATKSQLLLSLQDLVDFRRSFLLVRALDREHHESENLGSNVSIVIPFWLTRLGRIEWRLLNSAVLMTTVLAECSNSTLLNFPNCRKRSYNYMSDNGNKL